MSLIKSSSRLSNENKCLLKGWDCISRPCMFTLSWSWWPITSTRQDKLREKNRRSEFWVLRSQTGTVTLSGVSIRRLQKLNFNVSNTPSAQNCLQIIGSLTLAVGEPESHLVGWWGFPCGEFNPLPVICFCFLCSDPQRLHTHLHASICSTGGTIWWSQRVGKKNSFHQSRQLIPLGRDC